MTQPKSLKDMWQQAGPGLPRQPVTHAAAPAQAAAPSGPRYALRRFFTGVRDTANLMIGIPSYEAYLAHMAARHPDVRPMTEAEFFRNRQEARYGAGGARCC